jgi:D-alanine-D-alanine ligase
MRGQPAQFGKVAVLLGGNAAEREISLRSGAAVLEALRRRGVDAHPVDPHKGSGPFLEHLSAGGFDRAFIVLHGRGGEDGVVQGALETIELPYTGSGVLGSALGMDKYRCKLLWRGLGLPTADFALVAGEADLAAAAALGFPLMIKPVREGSSIGMAKAEDAAGLAAAYDAAARFDPLVLAERWIDGPEYTCAILGEEALPLIRLETPRAFYDYEAKYQSDSTRYLCPCGLPAAEEARLQELALAAFRAVGASGWGRVDIMVDRRQGPALLEINTVPGMTDHSLVPMAALARGIGFDDLVWRILETSLKETHHGQP